MASNIITIEGYIGSIIPKGHKTYFFLINPNKEEAIKCYFTRKISPQRVTELQGKRVVVYSRARYAEKKKEITRLVVQDIYVLP